MKHEVIKKMQSLIDTAKSYVPPTTMNISDLPEVRVDVQMTTRIYKEGTPDEFQKWVAIIDKLEYYVPNSIIGQLQVLLAEIPKLTKFRVLKKGEGLNTNYQVIPLNS